MPDRPETEIYCRAGKSQLGRIFCLLILSGGMLTLHAGTVTGLVLDQSRTPVPALVVRLLSAAEGDEVAQATTDEEGRFIFPDLPVGRYELTIDEPRYQTRRIPLVVSGPELTELVIKVERILPAVAQQVLCLRGCATHGGFRHLYFAGRFGAARNRDARRRGSAVQCGVLSHKCTAPAEGVAGAKALDKQRGFD